MRDCAGHRFRGATLWYEAFDAEEEHSRPWRLTLTRLIHPLPFLAMLILHETPSVSTLIGGAIVLVGVYVAVAAESARVPDVLSQPVE